MSSNMSETNVVRSLDDLLMGQATPATKADIQDLRDDIQALREELLPRTSLILTGPAVVEVFRRLVRG